MKQRWSSKPFCSGSQLLQWTLFSVKLLQKVAPDTEDFKGPAGFASAHISQQCDTIWTVSHREKCSFLPVNSCAIPSLLSAELLILRISETEVHASFPSCLFSWLAWCALVPWWGQHQFLENLISNFFFFCSHSFAVCPLSPHLLSPSLSYLWGRASEFRWEITLKEGLLKSWQICQ